MGQFDWLVREAEAGAAGASLSAAELASALKLPTWVANLLLQRSAHWKSRELEDFRKFLYPTLKDLPDPFGLPDMEKAAVRVAEAVARGEPIAVYGDYDVDGTVGAALLRRFFRSLGVEPRVYQPDRKKEGYGINRAAVELLRAEGATLLISVDCGISNVAEAARARELGLDLIVVDHHEVPDPMPQALAVLDHKRSDNESKIHSLCGAGMGFYLALATRAKLRERGYFNGNGRKEPDLRELLDLVAVATIADMVPLVDENRVLAKVGLEKLRRNPQPGIKALLEVAGVRPSEVAAYHVGFVIGPRINASGRMGSANTALELLSTDDRETAQRLARELHTVNQERVDLQKQITMEALEQARGLLDSEGGDLPALVLASENWHEGVIGIVAAKVVEKFHRPVVVCAIDPQSGHGKGSVRSVRDLDILKCLQACAGMLEGFGGHKAAAGLSLKRAKLTEFRREFANTVGNEVEAMAGAGERVLRRALALDLDLTDEPLDLDSVRFLELLAPFGIGNPEPVLMARGLNVVEKRIMKEVHLKLHVRSGHGRLLEALWFNAASGLDLEAGNAVDLAFTPQISTFRGSERLELRIRDLTSN